jgi:hypothetical protein
MAPTNAEYQSLISNCLKYKIGIGTNTLLMTVIAFLVCLSISGHSYSREVRKTNGISSIYHCMLAT